MTTRRMQATNAHPAYVILIASPVQQWFDRLTTMMHVHCLVIYGTYVVAHVT